MVYIRIVYLTPVSSRMWQFEYHNTMFAFILKLIHVGELLLSLYEQGSNVHVAGILNNGEEYN